MQNQADPLSARAASGHPELSLPRQLIPRAAAILLLLRAAQTYIMHTFSENGLQRPSDPRGLVSCLQQGAVLRAPSNCMIYLGMSNPNDVHGWVKSVGTKVPTTGPHW